MTLDRPPGGPSRRRPGSPLPWVLLVAVVIGSVGATGVIRAAQQRTDAVERIDGFEGILSAVPDKNAEYPAENYLLVGSDTREGVDPNSPDFQVIGDGAGVGGRRSDTIMVLRQEHNGGAALLSLPRDLWVEIAGTGKSQRINTAYNDGPERLAATVSQSLGIPIHHYVEVDFVGFKNIVDRLGGVAVCVPAAARDSHSGLQIDAGCSKLGGVQALAFARSRYYQEWNGEKWVTDPRSDLGRIERQQQFLRSAISGALHQLQSSPFGAGDTIQAIVDSLRIDAGLDPIKAGEALRNAVGQGLRSYALPVVNDTVGDAAVLRLGDGAEQVLAYFSGEGPPPVEFETGTTLPPESAAADAGATG